MLGSTIAYSIQWRLGYLWHQYVHNTKRAVIQPSVAHPACLSTDRIVIHHVAYGTMTVQAHWTRTGKGHNIT